MKKIYYLCLAAALTLSGCEDFLDSTNYTGKDSSNFPTSEQDVDQMVAAVYAATFNAPLNNTVGPYLFLADLASDDMYGGGGANDKSTQALDLLMYNSVSDGESQWTASYKAISRANAALASVSNVADSVLRNQTKGELQFLRAYNYFTLTQMFGSVPMLSKAPDNITEANVAPAQAPVDSIYMKIASDLYNATRIMPSYPYDKWSKITYGHATRWAAEALLARVYLFYTGFYNKSSLPTDGSDGVPAQITKDMVVSALEDCINNSGFSLLSDYRSLWAYSNDKTKSDYDYTKDLTTTWNDNNSENMFAIAFTYLSEWSGTQLPLTNQYALYFGIRANNWQDDAKYSSGNKGSVYPFGTGWGSGPVAVNLVDDWKAAEPNDKRIDASIMKVSDDYDFTNEDHMIAGTGYYNKKICPVRSDGGAYYTFCAQKFGTGEKGHFQASSSQDMILIRYADVLLMHSELTDGKVIEKYGSTGLNIVRKRAGLSDEAYSLAALQNERRWEFAFEGLRWGDIRRWHIAESALAKQLGQPIYVDGVKTVMTNQGDGYVARYKATNGFYRIPSNQISLSAGAYKQNAGWDGTTGYYSQWVK